MNLRRCTIALAVMAASAAYAAPAASQIVLKLHHFLPPKSPAQVMMLAPWAKRIEKASGGKVKIQIYPSMTLGGKPPELINQVRDGVVDIVWTVNGYTANLFPRTEVFELPFVYVNNPAATNLAMRAMFNKYLKQEYKGVHVLFLHVHQGQAIQTVDKPVHSPDDLKGLKMRIPSRTGAWVLEALGASPVGMPVPALPQALSRKVVDGTLIPWEIVPPFKLQELLKYYTEGPNMTRFGNTTFQVSMNPARWNSLPADVKKAFNENSGAAWVREVGKIWQEDDENALAVIKKAGDTHIVLTPAELEAFKVRLEPVVKRWEDEVKSKGIDGATLVKVARKEIAKYSK